MSSKPNILIINVDQQRYDCLGFTGNPIVRTPNLDALAASGMSFTSAYTPSPLCCPARQTCITSVMPCVHGGLWNFDNASPIKGVAPGEFEAWTDRLRDAGYRSAYIGKWHVHNDAMATEFGYDVYHPPFHYPAEEMRVRKYDMPSTWGGGEYDRTPLEETGTHRAARVAVETINDYAGSDQPWHIRLDYAQPHLPNIPAQPFADMYRPEDIPPWGNFDEQFANKPVIQKRQLTNWGIENWTWREWSIYLAGYYGVISQLDDAIGLVLRALEENGQLDNTLIIYTTDHGDAAGSHRMMDKHYVMYEEITRVPMVVRWDGVVAPGSTCDDFISHYLDLGPTLLELLGQEIPESFQGRSFLPQLRGEINPAAREYIFAEYNGQQFGLYTQRMVRDRRYKYIWNATDTAELYDLEADPFELRNLVGDPQYDDVIRLNRRRVYETFLKLDDQIMNSEWIRRALVEGLD